MGGNKSQKSSYNQARAQQNFEMQQYQQMWGKDGTGVKTYEPIAKAGNELLTGTNPAIQANEAAVNEYINQGEQAAGKQAASANASLYSGLSDRLSRARIRQGGYSEGFDATQADLARQTAEAQNRATILPAEQASFQRQNQANQNINNTLRSTQIGAGLASSPYHAQLAALGLTSDQINNLIRTQGSIAGQEPNYGHDAYQAGLSAATLGTYRPQSGATIGSSSGGEI